MTLDLTRIAKELREAIETVAHTVEQQPQRVNALLRSFDDDEVRRRIEAARTSWLLAIAVSRYFERVPPDDGELSYACVATDGSVVLSDRHGPVHFALINTGYCVLSYGESAFADLASHPRLLWKDDELWIADGARRIPVSGAALSVLRATLELELACCQARELALHDGTLIPWGLEGQVGSVVNWALERYAPALAAFRDAGIPLAGFISYPGSRDVMNVLRVAVCDYPALGRPVDCDDCLARVARGERRPACEVIPNLTDRWLFARNDLVSLRPGERTGCYWSRSTILRQLPQEDRILFFYLHTGTEIARVEIPWWVASDERLLKRVHRVLWDQCKRGKGYPLALQEAHEQAVVHQVERQQLDALIEHFFASVGVIQERSAKERSKRVRYA